MEIESIHGLLCTSLLRTTVDDAARVVDEEKVREDRVRALGVRVARWGWAEAGSTTVLGRRLAAVGVPPTRRSSR